MITIRNTPNAAGVVISGDFEDLDNLVDAFHLITVSEFDGGRNQQYIAMSTRVLGLCYDIRHASQGDREVELVHNNMTDEDMAWHSIIAPRSNVYYSCRYLYPEMFFVMLALNQLIELRSNQIGSMRRVYGKTQAIEVAWDKHIAMIRIFQAQFLECVRSTLTDRQFSRWMKAMNSDQFDMRDIASQYLDLLAVNYINLTAKQRLKSLPALAERITGFRQDGDHREIARVVNSEAQVRGCAPEDIGLEGIEFPHCFEW